MVTQWSEKRNCMESTGWKTYPWVMQVGRACKICWCSLLREGLSKFVIKFAPTVVGSLQSNGPPVRPQKAECPCFPFSNKYILFSYN